MRKTTILISASLLALVLSDFEAALLQNGIGGKAGGIGGAAGKASGMAAHLPSG